MPIQAREVYVRDERVFGVNWTEAKAGKPSEHEVDTAKLSAGMEGISTAMLSDYLDRHIDGGFEYFVDEHFEGTPFITEILKTAYRFWTREKTAVIRKALKLVLAYNLTQAVCLVRVVGSEEDTFEGKIEDEDSYYNGQTAAPVMINFQVKCAMADMWRELQKDILEELSALYSSIYSRDKLKNWPTIFILASILLTIWEEMQFDCRYRVPVSVSNRKWMLGLLTCSGHCCRREVLQRHGIHSCWGHCRSFLCHLAESPRLYRMGDSEAPYASQF